MTRARLGRVGYIARDHVYDDPEKEGARRKLLSEWRRTQIRIEAARHVKRVVREDGLAHSIEELFDETGRPPFNVDLRKMIRQYELLGRQKGWLGGIAGELHARLKEIDLVRYIQDSAELQKDIRQRRESRERMFESVAQEEVRERTLPSKLAAAIREAVRRDVGRRELRRLSSSMVDRKEIVIARTIQVMMRYLFFDYIKEGESGIPSDELARYDFLWALLWQIEALLQDLDNHMYELREFIESADLVALRME